MKKNIFICFATLCLLLFPAFSFAETIFFQENFDNANFSSRGWYDAPGGTISSTEHINGSTGSFECHWTQGGDGCVGGTPMRHKFSPSNSVYLSFWIKHSASWTGTGTHIFYLLTTDDGDYSGLARDHLDAYVNEGTITRFTPDLELQDALNIDVNNINVDLTQITENRASQGCNGLLENSQDFVSCYLFNGERLNMRNWMSPVGFSTTGGQYYMGDWHHVEAYYKLSDIDANGKGMANGILRFWLDGQQLINKTGVNFRTGARPNMLFNQVILAPYMGTSEADQTIWIDNLTVADDRPGGSGEQYTIVATADAGGTISPSGTISVNSGSSQTFTIMPNAGYQILDVKVDNVSFGAMTYYTLENVSSNHFINASFIYTGTPLSWSTTYNCPDWNEYPDPLNCDGIGKNGGWTCYPGTFYEQITSAANNLDGAGGKGQRHWIGDAGNNVSGGTRIFFDNIHSELWLRWYMRFQPGFQWLGPGEDQGFKVFYFYDTSSPTSNGFMYLMIHNEPHVWDMFVQMGDQNHYFSRGGGWEDLFPSGFSDGSWHEFEIHLKRETSASSADGVWEMWVDGVNQASHTNINFGMAGRNATIDNTQIGENSAPGANGGCAYVDFDDIAVSYTGYIGPLLSTRQFTITATAADGGTISPSGAVPVNEGADQTFTIEPSSSAYQIQDVKVDGISKGAITSYPFINVRANHTIDASFTTVAQSDLTISAFSTVARASAGTAISITDTTTNGGSGTANASVTTFYLSTDTNLDNNDSLIGSRAIPSLLYNESNSATTSVTIPTGTAAGTYYIIAKADGTDLLTETNETNNARASGAILIDPNATVPSLSDNFNRADENLLTGNWTTITGLSGFKIVNGHIEAITGGETGAYWNANPVGADQFTQVTVSAHTEEIGCAVRISPSSRAFYMMEIHDGLLQIWKYNGSWSEIGSPVSFVAPDPATYRLEISGTATATLTGYVNGISRISVQDASPLVDGLPGIYGYSPSTAKLDDWQGGELGTPPPSSLLWSTTFNCADWNTYGDSLNCDGTSKAGGWTCSPQGYYEQITAAANNPNGAGGKGQRHWIGDSLNNISGGLDVNFNASSEIWLRWYMRWQPGFTWGGGGFIVFYLRDTSNTLFSLLVIHSEPHVWDLSTQYGDGKHYYTTGGGWEDLFPSGASDGSWHEFEVHVKRETSASSADGVWEMWVDAVKKASHTNINFGMADRNAMLNGGRFGAESGGGANGGCAYVDYDDIAVSNTGYIGPITRASYNVSLSTGTGGVITIPVLAGSNQTFTITPNAGYHTIDVKVDGVSQGAITSYTFTDIRADHSLTTNFAAP